MGNEPKNTEPAVAKRASVWPFLAGLVVVAVVAVAAGIQFQWIPLGPPKPKASVEQRKLIVRYVQVTSPQTGQRSPAPAYIAEVRGDNELNLSFQVGGILDLIGPSRSKNWDEGAVIKSGTVLAQLRPDDFNNRIQAAQARADLAKVTNERMQNLAKSQSIPQEKADQAAAEKKAADAELGAAQQALKETILKAPGDGTILNRMVNPAEVVAPGRPVLRFSNLQRMSVDVGVPDTVIGRVRMGQEVPVVFSALAGRSFLGQVYEVGVAGEEGSRLFKVKIKVPNPEGQIKPGMTASVSFAPVGHYPPGAVWAPLAALTGSKTGTGAGELAVYLIHADNKVQKRIVQTDEIAGNQILITQGLKAGDKIVVAGVSTLYDGAVVEAQLSQ